MRVTLLLGSDHAVRVQLHHGDDHVELDVRLAALVQEGHGGACTAVKSSLTVAWKHLGCLLGDSTLELI
jgi:hypothetical protein